MKLLSPMSTNAKTKKGGSLPYLGAILHLAPFTLSGRNVCPKASQGCAAACLNSAGRGAFSNVQAARLRKTKQFFENRDEFLGQLHKDIESLERKAFKLGVKAVVRLNGTSDLDWFAMVDKFPAVQFYDYTKRIKLVEKSLKLKRQGKALNYHLTFSLAENNLPDALKALWLNCNVAAVFDADFDHVPEYYLDAPTINGELHDFRFLDPRGDGVGNIVALKAKGKAKKDKSGFVISTQAVSTETLSKMTAQQFLGVFL